MTEKEIRALIAELIGEIAPEADMSTLADDEDMREALDLDSMDFNNLIIALHKRTGINVPQFGLQQAVHDARRRGLSREEMRQRVGVRGRARRSGAILLEWRLCARA